MTRRRILLAVAPLALLPALGCSDASDDQAFDTQVNYIDNASDPEDFVTEYGSPEMDAEGARTFAPVAGPADETVAPSIPPDPNTFTDPGFNPWTDPATDAQSTFGLDVDTGSFNLARQWIEGGTLPPPESVRVEEYLNALIDLPAPESTSGLGITVGGARSPFEGAQGEAVRFLRVGVQSAPVDPAARPDVDLVFVVDVSGSMDAPNKLGLVQGSLALLTEELRPTDTVGMVVYGDQGRVELEPTPVSERERILDAIEELRSEGSTNAEEGLRLGYEMARANLAEGRVSRVVLASDGVANVGTTDHEALAAQLRDDADAGVRLVTVGFGMDGYNDTLMEQLADLGDGFYSYVDDYDEAVRLFRDELTASLVTVADDARSQVTFDPATVASYRLVGYENRDIADDDFTDDTVDAGEIGAGHSVTALYEVVLRPGVGGADRVATVDLRWLRPGTTDPLTASKTVERSMLDTSWDDADSTTRLAGLAAAWAEVLGASPVAAERSISLDTVVAEVEALEEALGQSEGFTEFAALVRRSAELD